MEEFVRKADQLSMQGIPFGFIIDFEMQKPLLLTPEQMKKGGILFSFHHQKKTVDPNTSWLKILPVEEQIFNNKFEQVKTEINFGNTYLCNLTLKTPITNSLEFSEIFNIAVAHYKILLPGEFVCFSPESFIRIDSNDRISTFPMKGTIDASLNNAEQTLLNDPKEDAEHYTIVDLMRNDISLVADQVEVARFKYLSKINSQSGAILQMSSEVCGKLKPEFKNKIGSILNLILPAGSITGAPKHKTCDIIRKVEKEPRGYYTGIAGFFDGKELDSCVLIRYLEREPSGKIFYRSGGGITSQSVAEKEYDEYLRKIYIPVF